MLITQNVRVKYTQYSKEIFILLTCWKKICKECKMAASAEHLSLPIQLKKVKKKILNNLISPNTFKLFNMFKSNKKPKNLKCNTSLSVTSDKLKVWHSIHLKRLHYMLKLLHTLSAFFSPVLPLETARRASFRDLTTSWGLFCDFPNRGIIRIYDPIFPLKPAINNSIMFHVCTIMTIVQSYKCIDNDALY